MKITDLHVGKYIRSIGSKNIYKVVEFNHSEYTVGVVSEIVVRAGTVFADRPHKIPIGHILSSSIWEPISEKEMDYIRMLR